MPVQQFNVLPRWLDGIPPKECYSKWDVELDGGKVIYVIRVEALDKVDANIKAQDFLKKMNEQGKRGFCLQAPPGVTLDDGFRGHWIKFRPSLVITLDIKKVV